MPAIEPVNPARSPQIPGSERRGVAARMRVRLEARAFAAATHSGVRSCNGWYADHLGLRPTDWHGLGHPVAWHAALRWRSGLMTVGSIAWRHRAVARRPGSSPQGQGAFVGNTSVGISRGICVALQRSPAVTGGATAGGDADRSTCTGGRNATYPTFTSAAQARSSGSLRRQTDPGLSTQ